MKDSLEARIAALPDVTESVLPMADYLFAVLETSCCAPLLLKFLGCSEECRNGATQTSKTEFYSWHGVTAPTPETLRYNVGHNTRWRCPACIAQWQFNLIPHALSADFNEETERARLMPV